MKKMLALSKLSATDLGDENYISLCVGEILDIETMSRKDRSTDFICIRKNHRISVMGCPDGSFFVLEGNESAEPAFKVIRLKQSLVAANTTIGRNVRVSDGEALVVETMYPNDIEWTKNYTFFARDNNRHQLKIGGVARSMFAVVEGEGQSVWDDDII